jgi:hypothetical protein
MDAEHWLRSTVHFAFATHTGVPLELLDVLVEELELVVEALVLLEALVEELLVVALVEVVEVVVVALVEVVVAVVGEPPVEVVLTAAPLEEVPAPPCPGV